MKVILNYFKPSGKWYAEAEYSTSETVLYKIWEQVESMQTLPGLLPTSKPYNWIISVDVPEHDHRHPHLSIPNGLLH